MLNDPSESRLFEQLNSRDSALAASVQRCWSETKKLLIHAASTHPLHTSHGPDHALALLDILDEGILPLDLDMSTMELYIPKKVR